MSATYTTAHSNAGSSTHEATRELLDVTVCVVVSIARLLGFLFFFFCLFAISWAAPAAYGGSQARGLIGASCWPTPQPQQLQIQASSAAYTTAHSNAGSSTH